MGMLMVFDNYHKPIHTQEERPSTEDLLPLHGWAMWEGLSIPWAAARAVREKAGAR